MAAPDAEFGLATEADWQERPARNRAIAGDVVGALFAIGGLVVLAIFLEHLRPSRICLTHPCYRVTPPEYYLVYGLALAILFGIAIAAVATTRQRNWRAPTRLRVSEDGLHFALPSGRDLVIPWPSGSEYLTIVDQRSVNIPGKSKIAVDGTLPIPPGTRTAALTGESIDAIVAAARARGLEVLSRHREADRSAGGLGPVTEYRIRPPPAPKTPAPMNEPETRPAPRPAAAPTEVPAPARSPDAAPGPTPPVSDAEFSPS
jgi:hypothetical protein